MGKCRVSVAFLIRNEDKNYIYEIENALWTEKKKTNIIDGKSENVRETSVYFKYDESKIVSKDEWLALSEEEKHIFYSVDAGLTRFISKEPLAEDVDVRTLFDKDTFLTVTSYEVHTYGSKAMWSVVLYGN